MRKRAASERKRNERAYLRSLCVRFVITTPVRELALLITNMAAPLVLDDLLDQVGPGDPAFEHSI